MGLTVVAFFSYCSMTPNKVVNGLIAPRFWYYISVFGVTLGGVLDTISFVWLSRWVLPMDPHRWGCNV